MNQILVKILFFPYKTIRMQVIHLVVFAMAFLLGGAVLGAAKVLSLLDSGFFCK